MENQSISQYMEKHIQKLKKNANTKRISKRTKTREIFSK